MTDDELNKLLKRWKKDADDYQKQVEEARAKQLPHDCMLGTMSGIRACIHDLELLLRK